jgi:hypothetical protein
MTCVNIRTELHVAPPSEPKKCAGTPFVGEGIETAGGIDVIFYPSIEDLCLKLAEFDAAKQAGNTGIDNRINSVLDELLRTQAISKDVYDNLYKNIFL